MSKTLLWLLVTASIILCVVAPRVGYLGNYAAAGASESRAQKKSQPTNVEITFEGLMILHKQAAGDYEIGIVRREIAHGHSFKVELDGKPPAYDLGHYLALGNSWVLEIKRKSGGTPRPGMQLRERGHRGRLMDSETGQSDVSWAVDLEGEEFHRGRLTLKPGNLTPIIQLPNGELSTKYKSPMVRRRKGLGRFTDFGFVAETTALGITLQPGEELVLKVANAGEKGVVFTLGADGGSHVVKIHNGPVASSHESHFKIYYDLFCGVPHNQKFDFRLKYPKQHPLNEYPAAEFHPLDGEKWLESLPCGLGILGRRTVPLE